MRNFRDAKSMAHMLREALATKHFKITVGESLELIAHLFGAGDWNTLSALIKNSEQDPDRTDARVQSDGPRFAPSTEAALIRAVRAAHERGQAESTVEDLLMMLTQDPDATAIMKASGVDPAAIRERLAHSAEIATPGDRNNMIDPQPTPAFQRVVQRAILDAQASGEWIVTGAHMLGAILSEQEGTAARILREQGLSRSDVVKIARSTG